MKYSQTREAKRLREAMVKRGVSPAQLAAATGYSIRTLENIASGTNRSFKTRQKISDALGEVGIWDDVRLSAKPRTIVADTVILRLTEDEARKIHNELPMKPGLFLNPRTV